MFLLREEKVQTERELEALQIPISVVAECLTMRDCRLGSELTYDDADTELKNELAVLENNQRILIDQCQTTWEKLNRLEEVSFKLTLEVENKQDAQNIDVDQLALERNSSNITYKANSTRAPKKYYSVIPN